MYLFKTKCVSGITYLDEDVGLGDTEKWVIDLMGRDPKYAKSQKELIAKSEHQGKEINFY